LTATQLWMDRKLSDFIKNIFICIPKMNEGLDDIMSSLSSENFHFWVNSFKK